MAMKKILSGLAAVLLAGSALCGKANAAGIESVTLNPVTNNASIAWDASCWATQYLIQASSSANGSVTGNTNDWIEVGSNATVTANANAHYHFANWSGLPVGANSNNNPASFTVDNSYTNILANFAIDTYTVTVSSAYGTVSPAQTNVVAYGSSFTGLVSPTNVSINSGKRMILKNAPKVTGHSFQP